MKLDPRLSISFACVTSIVVVNQFELSSLDPALAVDFFNIELKRLNSRYGRST